MKKRYGLLFGFGKESCYLLDKYKSKKPLLINVLGSKDTVHSKCLKWIAKSNGLKYMTIIPTKDKDSFHEDWEWDDRKILYNITIPPSYITKYDNNALNDLKGKIDILISGRLRKDLIKRLNIKPEDDFLPENIKEININEIKIIFPLWNLTEDILKW